MEPIKSNEPLHRIHARIEDIIAAQDFIAGIENGGAA
jgi:hypothetical protein